MFVSLLNYVSEFVLRQEWHRQWRGESEIDAAPTARAIGESKAPTEDEEVSSIRPLPPTS